MPREKSTRLSGMKKNPYAKPKKKVKAKTYKGRIIRGVTKKQREIVSEFFKVREGETQEQWKKRTDVNRLSEVNKEEENRIYKKMYIYYKTKDKKEYDMHNAYLKIQQIPRAFDFMRYYGVVINFFSIKYNVRVEDYQMGFYFYTNIPFTKQRFENACVLHFGTKHNKFNYFIKSGYLEEVTHTIRLYDQDNVVQKTNLYRLTRGFLRRLTEIYKVISKMNTLRTEQSHLENMSPEIEQIIFDMNDEIMDIQTGRVPVS